MESKLSLWTYICVIFLFSMNSMKVYNNYQKMIIKIMKIVFQKKKKVNKNKKNKKL